jgi:hypothetical protein
MVRGFQVRLFLALWHGHKGAIEAIAARREGQGHGLRALERKGVYILGQLATVAGGGLLRSFFVPP